MVRHLMTITEWLLLLVAGVGTGLVGYLTGLASLVSYPVLLSVGLSPVVANATNTVGLVGIGIGSTARSASMLRGRDPRALGRDLAIALVGGGFGAGLLLLGGNEVFAVVVPWLIVAASVAIVLSPRLRTMRTSADAGASPIAASTALFLLCTYGGYFGAGSGTMYLAVMLLLTSEDFLTSMVLKSLLLGISNLAASVVFIVRGAVDWPAAIALGLGCLLGGNLGPAVQKRIPEKVLRYGVAVAGLGLAAWLAFK